MTIGQKIRRMREEKGLGLAETAKEAGLARQRLWQIENDVSDNPSLKTLAQVAAGIHCSVIDIIRDTDFDIVGENSRFPCENSGICPFFKKREKK